MMQGISSMGTGMPILLTYAVVFTVMSKPASLYFWCAMPAVSYLENILKSIYAEQRPYWITDDITSPTCLIGFGNPSGHMLNTTFIIVSLYLHFYYDIGVKPKKMTIFCTAYIIKMAMSVVMSVFLILLAVSRVFLGAHAWNEVTFGFTLGLTFAFIGHYQVKTWFYESLWEKSL